MDTLHVTTWWPVILAVCLAAPLSGQFRGGQGDGFALQISVQLSLEGFPNGVRAVYSGGMGDGHDSEPITAALGGTLISTLFSGGAGDGFDHGTVSILLNGTKLAVLYAGGGGDGFDRDVAVSALDGTPLAGIFGGGSGDGYADLRSNTTLAGAPLYAIFSGGAGDGHDRGAFTAVLNGADLSVLYRGGLGQGFVSADYLGTVPLPLTLISFSAIPDGEFVLVKWVTEDEVGTDFFTIERTADGRGFAEVGNLPAAGNSRPGERLHYELLDEEPLSGTSFYRLRTTDFDGAVSLSHLVEVNISAGEDWSFSVFPNPNTGQHFSVAAGGIDPGDQLILEVLDVNGRRLLEQRYDHVNRESQRFELSEKLSTGSYLIRLRHARRGTLSKLLLVQ